MVDVGGAVPSDRDAAYVIGLGLTEALAHAAPDVPQRDATPSSAPATASTTCAHQDDLACSTACCRCCDALRARDHWLAVATGKSRRGLDDALRTVAAARRLRRLAHRRRDRRQAASAHAARADGEFGVRARAHADDRRHHARPAAGAQRRLRQRGRELRRARAGRLRRRCAPLHVAHSVRRAARLAAAEQRLSAEAMRRRVPLCNSARAGRGRPWPCPSTWCYGGQTCRAFAMRFEGRAHAYLNRCAHVAMEMDWQPEPLLRRHRPLAAVRHARRRLQAGHRRLRRRALPRRRWCASHLSESDGVVHWHTACEPPTGRVLSMTDDRCRLTAGAPAEPIAGRRRAPVAAAPPCTRDRAVPAGSARPGEAAVRHAATSSAAARRWRSFVRLAWLALLHLPGLGAAPTAARRPPTSRRRTPR